MDTELKQLDYLLNSSDYRATAENLSRLKDLCINSGLSPLQSFPKEILTTDAFAQLCSCNAALISASNPIINKVFESFTSKTRLFLLCDSRGYIISIDGSSETMHWGSQRGIVLGACLNYHSFGINSVSMAIHIGSATSIIGDEHYCDTMKTWIGIAAPIEVDEEIKGYINISDRADSDLMQYRLLVVLMSKKIKEQLKIFVNNKYNLVDEKSNPASWLVKIGKAEFFGKLIIEDSLDFTKKELEVMYQLYHGKSRLEIMNTLFISENTLKTHVRNIFKKTNVRSYNDCIDKINAILKNNG